MLNSPSHDVVYHTMLQKSGAKIQLLFELSKGYNLKFNVYFDFSVQGASFFLLWYFFFVCFGSFSLVVSGMSCVETLLLLDEADGLLESVHELFKIFFV